MHKRIRTPEFKAYSTALFSFNSLQHKDEGSAAGEADGWYQRQHWKDKVSNPGDIKREKKEAQCYENLIESLLIMQEELCDFSYRFPGYVQRVHCLLFSVMRYMETGIRIYHNLVKQQLLYCDATGNIVTVLGAKQFSSQPSPLYYSLVLQHSNVGHGPIAVAIYL